MFCKCNDSSGPTPSKAATNDLSGAVAPSRGSVWRKVALVGGLALGPHALCILGGGAAALGLGGATFHLWCGEQGSDADSSRGVSIKRLDAVPSTFTEFSPERSARAAEALLAAEPRFKEIIAAKSQAVGGAPIKTVFLENDEKCVSVVFCLNGTLCPCSVPQVYELGKREDIAEKERFPGQIKVLRALYGER